MKRLVVIVGPTAVGKTAVAIELARHWQTEVVSADSRQFYREMEIGTAKPTKEELSLVKHHFINSHSIFDEYNAGKYEVEALALLEKLFERHDTVVLVGGSGLYIQAVCEGFDDLPLVEEGLRESLIEAWQGEGLEPLLEELKAKDPIYYDQVDRNNHVRIIRALEVIRSTNKPFSSFRKKEPKERSFEVLKFGLSMERDKLYARIDARMDLMLQQGLVEEAQRLFSHRHLNALQTVGYTEVFDFLEGKYDEAEMVRLLKRNSRRYAKRQLTWFQRDEAVRWVETPIAFEQITSTT